MHPSSRFFAFTFRVASAGRHLSPFGNADARESGVSNSCFQGSIGGGPSGQREKVAARERCRNLSEGNMQRPRSRSALGRLRRGLWFVGCLVERLPLPFARWPAEIEFIRLLSGDSLVVSLALTQTASGAGCESRKQKNKTRARDASVRSLVYR